MNASILPGLRARVVAGLAAAFLAACGGGGTGASSVSTLTASSASFGKSMSVNVSGKGLDAAGLTMRADSGCDDAKRNDGATDYAAVFTCTVKRTGELVVHIEDADGDELARLKVVVPLPRASFTTASGTFVVEVDPTVAPATVGAFLEYVRSGFYKNTIFHRAIKDVGLLGGGYNSGPTLKTPTLAPIPLESANGLKNIRGAVTMLWAGADATTATPQFFVNARDNPEYDYVDAEHPGYTVIGKIVSGQDVVDAMTAVAVRWDLPLGIADVPVADLKITLAVQTQ